MIVSDAWLSKWNCAIDCLFSITVGTVARRCVLSVQAAQWQYRTLVTSAWSECVTIVDFSLMMNSECVKSVWLLTDCWHCSHSMWQGLCNSTLSTCLSVCLSHLLTPACCGGFAAVGPVGRRYRSVVVATGCRSSTAFSSKREQCNVVCWHRKLNTDLFSDLMHVMSQLTTYNSWKYWKSAGIWSPC